MTAYPSVSLESPYRSNPIFQQLQEVGNHIMLMNDNGYAMTMKQLLTDELGFYQKGMGYYRLRKKELIQPGKSIALVDNKTGRVYTGPAVRTLLRLPPESQKFNIFPYYNASDFTIYVQSTAPSRTIYYRDTVLAIIQE